MKTIQLIPTNSACGKGRRCVIIKLPELKKAA
jgi:hypothetical protein